MKKIFGRERRRSRSIDRENIEQNVIITPAGQDEPLKPVIDAVPEPIAPLEDAKPDKRDKTIAKLEKEIRVLKREIKGTKSEYEANSTSISELKMENERLEQERMALEAENLALLMQIEELKAELAARAEKDETAKKTQKEEAIKASQTFSASIPQRETGMGNRSRAGSLSAKKARRPSSQVYGLPPLSSGIF